MARRKKELSETRGTIINLLETELATHKMHRAEADMEITRLENAIAALGGAEPGNGRISTAAKHPRTRKVKRRSSTHLAKIAADVLEFVKTAGKDGVSGRDIQGKFGKLIPTPAKFLTHHGHKVRTTGAKVKMRYHA